MRVFVTGATGFIGTAVVKELIAAGHQVLGLARSDTSSASLGAAGAEVYRGSLDDLESLRAGAAASDGVIHLAFVHDFAAYATAGETDRQAVAAITDALAGSGKPFVLTSGTMLLAPGRIGTEEDAPASGSAASLRAPSEAVAMAAASRGVRSSILRLPPSVHGDGDHGFVPALIGLARDKRVSAYVGDGTNRWPAVHLLDAARLYRLALEKAPAGSRLHAVGDEGVPMREIAAVIGRRLNVPIVSKALEGVEDHFGWLARFVAIDNPASGALTRERLGWHTSQPGLLQDLERGSYFER